MFTRNPSRSGLAKMPLLYVLLLLLLASPFLSARLQPNHYEGGRLKDEHDRAERNTSAFALILGELRANLSDLMFIKTELYLHSGVGYMPHLDYDRMAQSGEIEHVAADDEPAGQFDFETQFLEHQAEVGQLEDEADPDEYAATVIPTQEEDFRGFIGALHRRVKPWRDPSLAHIHTDGTELLPWYRLMTLSDPHHIRAYMIGAWWLKAFRTDTHREEARQFLAEGIRNNPRAFQLYLLRGYMNREDEDIAGAMHDFERAASLAVEARPVEGTQHRDWTDYMEDDARGAVRMHVLMERDHGSIDRAIELAVQYRRSMGEAARFLDRILVDLRGQVPESPAEP